MNSFLGLDGMLILLVFLKSFLPLAVVTGEFLPVYFADRDLIEPRIRRRQHLKRGSISVWSRGRRELVYLSSFIVAGLPLFGVFSRESILVLMAILVLINWWNPMLHYSGTILAQHMLLILALMPESVLAQTLWSLQSIDTPHYPIFMLQFLLLVVYGASVISKGKNKSWWDGRAIFDALTHNFWSRFPNFFTEIRSPFFFEMLGKMTLLIEAGAVLLFFIDDFRPWMFPIYFLFHVLIGTLMRVQLFSVYMCLALLAFLSTDVQIDSPLIYPWAAFLLAGTIVKGTPGFQFISFLLNPFRKMYLVSSWNMFAGKGRLYRQRLSFEFHSQDLNSPQRRLSYEDIFCRQRKYQHEDKKFEDAMVGFIGTFRSHTLEDHVRNLLDLPASIKVQVFAEEPIAKSSQPNNWKTNSI